MVARSSSTSKDELIEDFDGEKLQVLLCPTIIAPHSRTGKGLSRSDSRGPRAARKCSLIQTA